MFGKTFTVILVLLVAHIVLLYNGINVLGSLTGGQTFTEWVASFADSNNLNFVDNAFDKVGKL